MEHRDGDAALLESAAREVAERERPRSKLRFGAKPGFNDRVDRFSTKAAPGPKGGEPAVDIVWARKRRREREAGR